MWLLYQNTLILAKRLATLDQLSYGILLIGLGLGHSKDEFQTSGVSFEKRGPRTDEYLDVLNKIWYDEIVVGCKIKLQTVSMLIPKMVDKSRWIHLLWECSCLKTPKRFNSFQHLRKIPRMFRKNVELIITDTELIPNWYRIDKHHPSNSRKV